jgi:hypothetical protein
MRCQHDHTWDWVEERWVCRECAEVSDCTCRPTDPGPYHLPKCPRSMRSHIARVEKVAVTEDDVRRIVMSMKSCLDPSHIACEKCSTNDASE